MYQKIKKKKIKRKHDPDVIKEALDWIGEGYTIRQAAEKFDIPKTTLHAKLQGKIPLDSRKGPPTVLTTEEENEIVKWIFYRQERGFPINKWQLLDGIQFFLNNEKKRLSSQIIVLVSIGLMVSWLVILM